MTLSPGSCLGSFEIVSMLGEGGMGEVYRARDKKLGREVAVKVLPETFAESPERTARFEREARLLASLNHPGIATLYGIEDWNGTQVLVMELVEGETLAQRIARGPVPVEEALSLFLQIAQALDAAHEKGVVHRDLKPSNAQITPQGKIKVLDFGLAKALPPGGSPRDGSALPTREKEATADGVVLGTTPYMSPEQVRGRTVDERTDVWAFGCCLFEALSGRRAFAGESVSDTMASVLEREPDWQALPDRTPASIRRVLQRCLRKDPEHRLHDVADARIEIEEALAESAMPRSRSGNRTRWHLWAMEAAVLLLALGVWLWSGSRPGTLPSTPAARYTINLPSETRLDTQTYLPALALSPDGQNLAFVALSAGRAQLYLRRLDELASRSIPGTEGAQDPFFSPDGRWLAFFAQGKLKKVSVEGGRPLVIHDAPTGRGGSWGPDGTIVFTPAYDAGLVRVAASGGPLEILTKPDADERENSHRWPTILPDGKHVLFTIRRGGSFDDSQITLLSLETGEMRPVLRGGSHPQYAPTGHLVFARAGALLAVRFDPRLGTVRGPMQPLSEVAETSIATGASQFTFSENGLLAYVPADERTERRRAVWVDRQGRYRPLLERMGAYTTPRLSPDGSRLVLTSSEAGRNSLWVHDLVRGALSRLSFDGSNAGAIWALGGGRLIFNSDREGPWNLFSASPDRTDPPERLTWSEHWHFPQTWSQAAKRLAYVEFHPITVSDIWLLSTTAEREPEPEPFLITRFEERQPAFSPDGRFIAYISDESGSYEVYVRPVAGATRKWKISAEGGVEPLWSRDGSELFYRNGFKMMAVKVVTRPEFEAAKPVELFDDHYLSAPPDYGANFDVGANGEFVMIEPGPDELSPTQISVVVNWFSELERLVPDPSAN